MKNVKRLRRFFIQHLLLESDCCISRNVGKLKMISIKLDYVELLYFFNLNNDVNIHLLMFFELELFKYFELSFIHTCMGTKLSSYVKLTCINWLIK